MTDSRRILLGAVGEEEYARRVKRLMHTFGWHAAHVRYSQGVVEGVHTTRRHGHSDAHGVPDWWAVHEEPGHPLLALELKTETGRLSPDQRLWQKWLGQSRGLVTRVMRPTDDDELLALLEAGR